MEIQSPMVQIKMKSKNAEMLQIEQAQQTSPMTLMRNDQSLGLPS